MKQEKKQLIFYGSSAAAALIFAVLSFVCSAHRESTAISALFVICGVLLLVLTALMAVLVWLSVPRDKNFFLYDAARGANIAAGELTEQRVNARLDEFIEESFGDAQRLLVKNSLAEGNFGLYAVLRPAVAYRLLYLASEDAASAVALQTCDDQTLRVLCQALRKAGETDMADAILRHRETGGSVERLTRFLSGNRKYIQSRLMSYIKRNMELFY